MAVTPYSSVLADTRSHHCLDGAGMQDGAKYVSSERRQPSLLTEHDRDKQRSVHGSTEDSIWLIRAGMGAVDSDQ